MITCPSCQQQNEAGAAFCDNCGYDLRAMPPVAVPTPPVPTPQVSGGTPCPSCSHNNVSGAVFCESCGNPLGQAAPPPGQAAMPPAGGQACPSCGHAAVPGGAFCENCGSALGQAAPVSPPVSPPVTPPAVPSVAGGQACANCGHQNMPGTGYCENCGAQLGQVVAPPPPPQNFIGGHLVIQASNQTINIPPNKTEAFVGREDPVSGIFPEIDLDPHGGHDSGVGRKHARLFLQGNQLMLEDLDSVNGTFLNKQKLAPRQPQPVNNGAELRFGKIVTIYHAS